jgi:hypothetical protein
MLHQSAVRNEATSYIGALNPNDVLQGRGAGSDRFEGNIRFRAIVRERQSEYRQASEKEQKDRIAMEIFLSVQAMGGRFVRKVDSITEAESLGIPLGQQGWLPIDETAAIEKVKQALRDKRHDVPSPDARSPTSPGTPQENLAIATRHVETTRVASPVPTSEHRILATSDQGENHHASTNPTLQTVQPATYPNVASNLWNRGDGYGRVAIGVSVSESFHSRGQIQQLQQLIGRQPTVPPPLLDSQARLQPHDPSSAVLPHRNIVVEQPTMVQHHQLASFPNMIQPAISQSQRECDLKRQLAAVLVGDPRRSTLDDISRSNRLADSWRDIPETYQTLFPLIQQPMGPHFASKDLRALLLTESLAELVGDVLCLGRLQSAFRRILELPPIRLRLDHTEMQSLVLAVNRLQAVLSASGGP